MGYDRYYIFLLIHHVSCDDAQCKKTSHGSRVRNDLWVFRRLIQQQNTCRLLNFCRLLKSCDHTYFYSLSNTDIYDCGARLGSFRFDCRKNYETKIHFSNAFLKLFPKMFFFRDMKKSYGRSKMHISYAFVKKQNFHFFLR